MNTELLSVLFIARSLAHSKTLPGTYKVDKYYAGEWINGLDYIVGIPM